MTDTALIASPKKNAIIGVSMKDLSDVSTLIFNSKVFGDLQSKEAAAIKIIAGQELGFTPFQSMSMFDFIQGRPTLNAHGKATLINSSGDFRLKIKTLTSELCEIDVCRKSDSGEWKVIGTNTFSIDDAKKAELTTGKNQHSWKKYPRNMLFARCVSNIWRWECAELNTRRFNPEQIAEFDAPELNEDETVDRSAMPETTTINGETVDTRTGEVIDAEIIEPAADMNHPHPAVEPKAPTDETTAASTLLDDINELFKLKCGDGEAIDEAEAAKVLGTRDMTMLNTAGLEKLRDELAAM